MQPSKRWSLFWTWRGFMTSISTKAIYARFGEWFEAAMAHPDIDDATAMCLATADMQAHPSARIVLLKGYDRQGFVFFTNLESCKSVQLSANPHAALCFHWPPLGYQVRIEGHVEPVGGPEADAYFATRPRESQIGAWASRQSAPLKSRKALLAAVERTAAEYRDAPIPRPPHWGGWRVVPDVVEYWSQEAHRLHRRERFTRQPDDGWKAELLYP